MGGLGRDINNFILMQQNGNEAKNKWSSNMFAIHFISTLLYFALAFGTWLLIFSKLMKCDVKRRGGGGGSGSSVTMTLSVQTIVWRCPLTNSRTCDIFSTQESSIYGE